MQCFDFLSYFFIIFFINIFSFFKLHEAHNYFNFMQCDVFNMCVQQLNDTEVCILYHSFEMCSYEACVVCTDVNVTWVYVK